MPHNFPIKMDGHLKNLVAGFSSIYSNHLKKQRCVLKIEPTELVLVCERKRGVRDESKACKLEDWS